MDAPSDDDHWIELTVDLIYGEFVDVHGSGESIEVAVRHLCVLSGVSVPGAGFLSMSRTAIG
jgi:hypothetical protein